MIERIRKLIGRISKAPQNENQLRPTDPFEIAASITEEKSPVVVDGGACVGSSIEKIKENFSKPFIYAVEPLCEHFEELRRLYKKDKMIELVNCAIGPEEGKITISRSKKKNSSSVYEPSEYLLNLREEDGNSKRKYYEIDEKVEVDQRTIDEITREKRADVIKLDLQGYELPALRGAKKSLERCDVIITEVEFVQFYKEQPLFRDVDEFLSKNGFSFFSFGKLRVESGGRITTTDAIYISDV